MTIGKFKIYVMGFGGQVVDAKAMGASHAQQDGKTTLVFETARTRAGINYAEAIALWIMPHGEIDETAISEAIDGATTHDVPVERFRDASCVHTSNLFKETSSK